MDFGDWTGRTFQEVARQDAWRWASGASIAAAPARRAAKPSPACRSARWQGCARSCARYPDRYVLVVSHGDVIKAVIASCLGLSLDLLERFDIAPASVSVLAMGEGWSQLRLLNAQGPLH